MGDFFTFAKANTKRKIQICHKFVYMCMYSDTLYILFHLTDVRCVKICEFDNRPLC